MISNNSERISLWQLFLLIFIFETGSSVIVGLAKEAERDAWIAVLIAGLLGVGLMMIYIAILNLSPGKHFFEIVTSTFGKVTGAVITLIYSVYFFYLASFVLRDFGELLVSSFYSETPIEFFLITTMIAIIFALFQGMETIARSAEIFFPYTVFAIFFFGFGVLASGEMELKNAQPILSDGFTPIWQAIFPVLLNFPFGEAIVFTMIIPMVSNKRHARRVSGWAIFLTGIVLSYSAIIQLATLGPEMRSRAQFPLLSSAREISLLAFIERVDLLIVFVIMFGIIIQISVFLYGGLKGLEHVFKKPYRRFLIPIGSIIPFVTILIGKNSTVYLEKGVRFLPSIVQFPLQVIFPVLFLLLLLLKTRYQRKRGSQ